MNLYIGTKIVQAEPAEGMSEDEDGMRRVVPGYKVRYADGYESWSPKEVFDVAYRQLHSLPFSLALEAVMAGNRIARAGWNGKGMWVEIQRPDEHSKMNLPYLYLNYPANAENTPGARVPWLASQTDLLSADWEVLQ